LKQQLKNESELNYAIKEKFESFFERQKTNKMNIIEFSNLVDQCEIDVETTAKKLYDHKFYSCFSKIVCRGLMRVGRNKMRKTHVEKWDEMEKDKNSYKNQSQDTTSLNLDGLSKYMLVIESVTQLVDLVTDIILLRDTYLISRVKMKFNTLNKGILPLS
jgi:hypothetical protein